MSDFQLPKYRVELGPTGQATKVYDEAGRDLTPCVSKLTLDMGPEGPEIKLILMVQVELLGKTDPQLIQVVAKPTIIMP